MATATATATNICMDWLRGKDGCSYGVSCKYDHRKISEVCRNWVNGKCKYSAQRCQFIHAVETDSASLNANLWSDGRYCEYVSSDSVNHIVQVDSTIVKELPKMTKNSNGKILNEKSLSKSRMDAEETLANRLQQSVWNSQYHNSKCKTTSAAIESEENSRNRKNDLCGSKYNWNCQESEVSNHESISSRNTVVCDVAVAHAQNLVNPSEHIRPDFLIPITAKKTLNSDIRVEQLMHDLKDLLISAAEKKKRFESDDSVLVDAFRSVRRKYASLLTECKDVAKKAQQEEETSKHLTAQRLLLYIEKIQSKYQQYMDDTYDDFICPITQEIMDDPVIAVDGHTYDRIAIEEWFTHKRVSPKTNSQLDSSALLPNHLIKRQITEWKERQRKSHVRHIFFADKKRHL